MRLVNGLHFHQGIYVHHKRYCGSRGWPYPFSLIVSSCYKPKFSISKTFKISTCKGYCNDFLIHMVHTNVLFCWYRNYRRQSGFYLHISVMSYVYAHACLSQRQTFHLSPLILHIWGYWRIIRRMYQNRPNSRDCTCWSPNLDNPTFWIGGQLTIEWDYFHMVVRYCNLSPRNFTIL